MLFLSYIQVKPLVDINIALPCSDDLNIANHNHYINCDEKRSKVVTCATSANEPKPKVRTIGIIRTPASRYHRPAKGACAACSRPDNTAADDAAMETRLRRTEIDLCRRLFRTISILGGGTVTVDRKKISPASSPPQLGGEVVGEGEGGGEAERARVAVWICWV